VQLTRTQGKNVIILTIILAQPVSGSKTLLSHRKGKISPKGYVVEKLSLLLGKNYLIVQMGGGEEGFFQSFQKESGTHRNGY